MLVQDVVSYIHIRFWTQFLAAASFVWVLHVAIPVIKDQDPTTQLGFLGSLLVACVALAWWVSMQPQPPPVPPSALSATDVPSASRRITRRLSQLQSFKADISPAESGTDLVGRASPSYDSLHSLAPANGSPRERELHTPEVCESPHPAVSPDPVPSRRTTMAPDAPTEGDLEGAAARSGAPSAKLSRIARSVSTRSLLQNEKFQAGILMQLPNFQRQAKPSHSDLLEHNGRIQLLSVDDEGVNQMVLEMLLAKHYDLVTASDGYECLQYIQECSCLPDLVLMDIMLPGLSGYEVVRRIRQEYSPMQLPIIMVTAHTSERDVLRWLDAGANDFIPKPVKYQEVVARINTLMSARKSMAAEAEARSHYKLLSTMLPPHIITKLKHGNNLIAEKHEQVTVLFTDIVGFTIMAGSWPTERIVLMLNEMFTAFDKLCDKHRVHKVETIGDAYMVVAGHDGADDHPQRVLDMAADMLYAVQRLHSSSGKEPIRIRVGVHTGPALSGVVGIKCPRYCFFGDTVNTASRMESHGFPMVVHCSPAVVEQLQLQGCEEYDFVRCPPRQIKGKGLMSTYLLKVGQYEAALRSLN